MLRTGIKQASRVAAGMAAVFSFALAGGAVAQTGSNGDYMPTFTIEEVMASIVMPTAGTIWNAVAVNVSADGITESKPETDEDWEKLRWAAVNLAEATNLLLIPGRVVASPAPGEEEEANDGDLTPEQIQAMLKTQWPTWVGFAHALHAVALQTIDKIDNKDVDGLLEVGGDLDAACESCHVHFWYPNQ